MLDLYKLEIFAAVVQEGSFSAAAERLYMTQSAVSQHIAEVEARLGTQLFQRGWRGVTPTQAGQTLYEYARKIFTLVAEAENAVTDVNNLEGGQINIGATPGVGVYLLPDWTQAFRARYPNLTVSLQTGVTAAIVRDVLGRKLELGFVEGELDEMRYPRLAIFVLEEVEQYAVIGSNHAWWERDDVDLTALNEQSFIMRPRNSQTRAWLDHILQERGVQARIVAEFDNIESIKRAVASGQCLTILPEYVVRHEEQIGVLRRLTISGAPLQRALKLVWDRDTVFSPVSRAFLRFLGAHFPRLRGEPLLASG